MGPGHGHDTRSVRTTSRPRISFFEERLRAWHVERVVQQGARQRWPVARGAVEGQVWPSGSGHRVKRDPKRCAASPSRAARKRRFSLESEIPSSAAARARSPSWRARTARMYAVSWARKGAGGRRLAARSRASPPAGRPDHLASVTAQTRSTACPGSKDVAGPGIQGGERPGRVADDWTADAPGRRRQEGAQGCV